MKKSLLCKIGIHRKQKCGAPYVILGEMGRIETWVCKRCNYKHKNGIFIKDKK